MGYESLSAVVVLVIVVIVMAGWLPARTAKGMRTVAEHREDKYSPSLHLIDIDDGTRFSDEHTPRAKGIIMQSDPKYTAERVAYVRQLRRAAIRRRRVLVLSLLALTVLVLVLAIALKFSPLFALIPGVLLVVSVALGVRAAAQARAWEAKVATSRRRAARARAKAAAQVVVEPAQSVGENSGAADRSVNTAEADTDVMEQREIRQALNRARQEQEKAFAERAARRAAAERKVLREAAERVAARADAGDDQLIRSEIAVVDEHDVESAEVAAAAETATDTAAVTESRNDTAAVPDETSELASVSPSRALDAFDMASAPDLISFSLGAPRNGIDVATDAPESREIQSTRQVAKAVPVESATADDAQNVQDMDSVAADVAANSSADSSPADNTDAADDASSKHAQSNTVNDTAAFHETEQHVAVDAPEATSDSLGHGLEAILARRSS
ncbi:hypothetical protein [Bifidobacterium hapali]|nr:hypothetical protein [Bifidobacterium hapali]